METLGAPLGALLAALLATALGVLGRRYEGRESRAVATQAAVIDDLEHSNTRLRTEATDARTDRDVMQAELRTALTALELAHHQLGLAQAELRALVARTTPDPPRRARPGGPTR